MFLESQRRKRLYRKYLRALDKDIEDSFEARAAVQAAIDAGAAVEEHYLPNLLFLINISQFTRIFTYDLIVTTEEFNHTEDGWRKRLSARLLALSIAEFFDDISELLGKDFRRKLQSTKDCSANLERLNSITNQWHQLESKHKANLREIRNVAIAHRDKNASAQINIIMNLDVEGLETLAADVFKLCSGLQEFLTDLMEPMAQELAEKSEQA